MTSMNDRNGKLIEEFRGNQGKVGGYFADSPLLLLTTTGARSGERRTNPLMYLQDGDRWIVFASKGGAPANPDWFHNLSANAAVTIEVGAEVIEADAEVVVGEERDRLYARQSERYPQFGEYQRNTARTIPVIALSPRS